MKTLIIGDVHGHFDRLEALLLQEGVIDRCKRCNGNGMQGGDGDFDLSADCPTCHGDGWARTDKDVYVVQLGDLGHVGQDNRTGDMFCYRAAVNGWIDLVLWGNHDRFAIDAGHAFRGCVTPTAETQAYMDELMVQGRYKLAHNAHGWLVTHAGLHVAFRDQQVDMHLKNDVQAFVDWINDADDQWFKLEGLEQKHAIDRAPELAEAFMIRDAVGSKRGGSSRYGGILWRDKTEKLYAPFPQVFGHSAHSKHIVQEFDRVGSTTQKSYCIDIGGRGDREGDKCLAGIYLPDQKVVTVGI